MSNWWSVFIAMRGAYLIAARAWPEVSVGKIKLFDAEGTGGGRVSLAGEEGEAGRVGRWVLGGGGEGSGGRARRDGDGAGWSYQVSSSSSKKVSWGAIVAE